MAVKALPVAPAGAQALRATRVAEHAPTFALALACTGVLAFLGLTGFAFSDYDLEAAPAILALLHGDLAGFLGLAPAYGGSLVLRAPFAAAPVLWGGGELAAFRAGALPGLLACAILATVVVGHMRAGGRPRLDRAVVLVALAASPVALRALEVGHPEELLGAALCVGAVLAAPRRPLLGAVLLGLAVANKPWALIAVPVVLAATPAPRRVGVAAIGAAVAGAVLAPLLLGSGGNFATTTHAARGTGAIFQPWQVWYLLGGEPTAAQAAAVGGADLRAPPAWLADLTRPLILFLAAAVTLAWWGWRNDRVHTTDALLLLALLFQLRCVLDPWNFSYYALPALLALASWEGLARPRRVPFLSPLLVLGVWQSFEVGRERLSPDMASLVYLGWAMPMVVLLGALLLKRPRAADRGQARGFAGRLVSGQTKVPKANRP